MKAAVYRRYGGPEVVSIVEVPKPVPGPREVLVRIHAATVSSGDWRARSLDLPPGFGPIGRLVFGIFGPRKPILGTEFSGVVEAVGAEVSRFAPGDAVFGFPGLKSGAHAEYAVMEEGGALFPKPERLSFEEAAALGFGGTAALTFLRDLGQVQPGERVLVNGASGTVGSAAVQVAKHLGAHVTAVCGADSAEMVRGLGADAVIDYRTQDFVAGAETWDAIVDTAGTAPFERVERALAPGGRLLLVLGGMRDFLRGKRQVRGKWVMSGVASEKPEDVAVLVEMAEAGAFTPVIDSVFPFDEVQAAHARVDSGHKHGSVVLRMVEA